MGHNAIILAAGKGTRMKSNNSKVLHHILGKPMVQHVIDNLHRSDVSRNVVIVGNEYEEIKNILGDSVEYAIQKEQLGTGHAVLMAEDLLKDEEGTTIVICGDTPLISSQTIDNLLNYHIKNKSDATILTAVIEEPKGYGRIVRNENDTVLKIIEHKDASEEIKKIKEVNTGTFCFNNKILFSALKKVTNENAQGEYYLTDVIQIINDSNGVVKSYVTDSFEETIGINNRAALAKANNMLKLRINNTLMDEGVTIIDPNNTYISSDTIIGEDTIIYPGCMILGTNKIGSNCIIGPNTQLNNVTIGNDVVIKQSVVTDSSIDSNTTVGPFAHFRNKASIGKNVRIGNFVEIKNSDFGDNSNAAHLAYIGDANIGNYVNMGCGSITVNYDGKNKHRTVVGNNVFVGCNSNLIAPIKVEDDAYIAAGSTITDNVPKDALAIARGKQITKEGYAKKYKK